MFCFHIAKFSGTRIKWGNIHIQHLQRGEFRLVDKYKSPSSLVHASLLFVSGCVGFANNPQAPFTSFFSFFFLGWGPGIPSGPLWAVLSSTVLGMGPLPVGITIAFSFFPSFLHSKVEFTRGGVWDADFISGVCAQALGGGQCTFGPGRRSALRLSTSGMRPRSERNSSSSVEPQLSFPCLFEKPLSVNCSATPLVVTRYSFPPSRPIWCALLPNFQLQPVLGWYTWVSAASLLPVISQPTSGNYRSEKIVKQPRVLVLIVNHR